MLVNFVYSILNYPLSKFVNIAMSKKVMIVEDDKMLCRIFEMFLTDLGYEVTGFFPDGDSAIACCMENHPDVILMDIHLKGDKTGFETAKIILEKFDIPIIYLTGDNREDTIKETIFSNIYGYLLKPTTKIVLNTAIEFAYHRHRFDQSMRKT